jgi:2-methylisocitrate lyase-like PEP mutase family enzyme
VKLGKIPLDKIQKKKVSRELGDFRRSAHANAAKAEKSQTKKVSTAIKSLKLTKRAGYDGIFPEFLRNLGPRVKYLCAALMKKSLKLTKGAGYD